MDKAKRRRLEAKGWKIGDVKEFLGLTPEEATYIEMTRNPTAQLTDIDHQLLRSAITLARRSREHGNHPFGAVLADENGRVVLEAENTVLTGPDSTGHAETNLMRLASNKLSPEALARCTLYTSTEPCPMCAGAIYWGGVGRVVYALGQAGLYDLIGPGADRLLLPCRDVFGRGVRPIQVIGPALEDEALQVHLGFWVK
jgi:tRNA(Arg) A34 adenosine deaminase TadA